MSAAYGTVRFLPTGGIDESKLLEYLNFDRIIACGGSWMVEPKAIAAKEWSKIETLTRNAVALMLGLELKHVGINSGNPEQAMKDAQAICRLLGWEVKEGNNSTFAGTAFELMKKPFRGTHGHVAIACNDIRRAKWHLERRGFVFDENSANMVNGVMKAIYLCDEIAGFAFHLLQK